MKVCPDTTRAIAQVSKPIHPDADPSGLPASARRHGEARPSGQVPTQNDDRPSVDTLVPKHPENSELVDAAQSGEVLPLF